MVKIITFGCRANAYDSKVLGEQYRNQDAIIVNTCAVTKEAVRQVKQKIRQTAKENPGKEIWVTGCAARIDKDSFKDYKVLPPVSYSKKVLDFDGRVRAFIPIQTGCNNACTYCVVPQARGKAKAFPKDQILSQIGEALKSVPEIVLTGIDLASYPGLPDLIRSILYTFPQLERLRLGSFDPALITDDIVDLFKTESRLMPHLHLSMQHASDMILKRMGRRHLSRDVSDKLKKLRSVRPEIVFGADFICGFPTESDDDFKSLMYFVKDNHIALLHVFPYSERPDTPAAQMPPVPVNLRRSRAAELRNLGLVLKTKLMETYIGRDAIVLLEEKGRGYTDTYLPVRVTDTGLKNQFIRVKIKGVEKGEMIGGLVQ